MLKDVKPIFVCAVAKSEAKIVERILVSVLPELMAHQVSITPEMIANEAEILLPESLYDSLKKAAEQLTGFSCHSEGK